MRSKIRKHDLDRMIGLLTHPPPLTDAAKRNPAVRRLYEDVCRRIATGRVGTAHANEAKMRGIAFNLRTLGVLERRYDRQIDFALVVPFEARRRVSLPAA